MGTGIETDGADTIDGLVVPSPVISPDVTCETAYDIFQSDEDLLALPVVVEDRPVGLVERHDLILRLADRFGRPLYGKKPISQLMDDQPLIVETSVTVEGLSRLIVSDRPAALLKGFIVVEGGRYKGIGTALSLLRLNVKSMEKRQTALDAALEEATSANRAKSMMLSNASHELRTPLNAIIGFADFVINEPFGPIAPVRYKEYLQDIHASGNHLLNLVNDILDMAKLESGAFQLHESDIAPCDIAETVARITRHSAWSAGLRLDLATDCAGTTLWADDRGMRQILLNLVSNAIKFTPVGGTVSVDARVLEDGGFRFTVSDTGIGISAENMEQALMPFGQAHDPINANPGGTGLGLPLAKAIAEAHGGSLVLTSEPGKGTSVDVTLPPSRVRQAEQAAAG
jgi:two-component system cell cycle sensor histidine kinase PleC